MFHNSSTRHEAVFFLCQGGAPHTATVRAVACERWPDSRAYPETTLAKYASLCCPPRAREQPPKRPNHTKVVGVVMMTSAIIFGMERGLNDGEGTGAFNEPGWQWHDAFYFTIVTLSTVG